MNVTCELRGGGGKVDQVRPAPGGADEAVLGEVDILDVRGVADHVRAVRLGEDEVCRAGHRSGTHVIGAGERDGTTKGDVAAQLDEGSQHLRPLGEAVEVAARLACALLGQHAGDKRVRGVRGIICAIANVQLDGQVMK